MLEIRQILCPNDLSEPSRAAFRVACALARDYGATLLVLHVYPPPANGAEAVDRARNRDFEKDLVDALRANTPEHLGVVAEFRVAEGTPSEAILRAARDCDLVVIGTHGHGGILRALLGSVAEQVLRHAPCPVMTVRPAVQIPAEADAAATRERPAEALAELGVGD